MGNKGEEMYLLTAPEQPLQLAPRATARIFSFGGGVQSTAALVLQATGRMLKPYDAFVFSNVGHDSENPDTIRYIEEVSKPYAAKHRIKIVEVQKHTFGKPETLLGYAYRTERSIPLPVYMEHNGAPGNRSCTADFKIRVVEKWCKQQGYPRVTQGLGISLDEVHRMHDAQWHDSYGKRKLGFWTRREYPLISLRLRRLDCLKIIKDAGLPQPPKSSCWFCPFQRPNVWIEMKREKPKLFKQAVALEKMLNAKRSLLGRDPCYLHPARVSIDQAVGNQLPMFPDWKQDNCESGYCFV